MNRQALAALGAPALEHRPSVLLGHPGPKPVLFRAAAVVRLIRSLRHNCSPLTSPESENLEFTGKSSCLSKTGHWLSADDHPYGLDVRVVFYLKDPRGKRFSGVAGLYVNCSL